MLTLSDNVIFHYTEHEEAAALLSYTCYTQYESGGDGTDNGH